MAMEKTLVLIKPDGVKRGLMGRILSRFEDAGMKIVGMKLRQSDEAHALKHYTDDIEKRRGKKVRDLLVDFLKSGPVLAFVVEGINAIENVRKMVGATEPKAAAPGTIRGDFAHISYSYADEKGKVVENLIHASSDATDAEREVWLWFNEDELCEYKSVHEAHTL
jgi:nucleoside-diphosphate kinase